MGLSPISAARFSLVSGEHLGSKQGTDIFSHDVLYSK